MAKVRFTSAKVAERFVRYVDNKSARGRPTPAQWLVLADAAAAPMADRLVAEHMLALRHKSGARFEGVYCQCCGTRLSAPESVLAGIGPKCQAR